MSSTLNSLTFHFIAFIWIYGLHNAVRYKHIYIHVRTVAHLHLVSVGLTQARPNNLVSTHRRFKTKLTFHHQLHVRYGRG